jgi:hypothetical protein
MTDASNFYEPPEGYGLTHNPLKAIVAPRPIGWFSTVDEHGSANLAPYSFFNAFCSRLSNNSAGSALGQDQMPRVSLGSACFRVSATRPHRPSE